VNWTSTPSAVVGSTGVTAIDTSVASATVSVVLPVIAPRVAEIDDGPGATGDARPPVEIVATPVSADPHVTDVVRFCVVVSENVPVAVNWTSTPIAVVGLAGVTASDSSVALVTVTVVEPDTVSTVAEIPASPGSTP